MRCSLSLRERSLSKSSSSLSASTNPGTSWPRDERVEVTLVRSTRVQKQLYALSPHNHCDAMELDEPEPGPGGLSAEEFVPQGPKPIKKLSKDVINQIAAAEVSSLSTGRPVQARLHSGSA